MLFIGLMPLGSLVAGLLAEKFSIQLTSILFASLSIVASVQYLRISAKFND